MRDDFSLHAFPHGEFFRAWKKCRHNCALSVFDSRCMHDCFYNNLYSAASENQSHKVLHAWIFRVARHRGRRTLSAHPFCLQPVFADLCGNNFIYFLHDFFQIGQNHLELDAHAGERKDKLRGRML